MEHSQNLRVACVVFKRVEIPEEKTHLHLTMGIMRKATGLYS